MPPHRSDLCAAWRELAGPGERAAAVGAELVARWDEPHRRHHTLHHLRAVLEAVGELAEDAADITAVRYAAWFHDAVYQGEPGADEERSARLAEELLPACGVDARRVAEVARLVRVTAAHRPRPGDADAEVLCDADLSVLGGTPEEYAAYARAVREEYRHVADADFRAARAALLEGLLAAPALFHTERARALWEARARANVAAEVRELTGTAPGPGDATA
ncbi:HD domain-containing protein [Marinactinospora thermotolerans]|uniref:Predicted metal-dependent phosphohydrolase, HD superfamily n=1 Tax=Marinactinospora thermotolerans DSM 45154 TaxID=1122192 RepID=A0A1T4M1F2_9ACTN|nr:metal-dependent phosphohydrolase [Marinactinospora thermotolerans]SJZ60751.1 Predicted metal-dependent phosphohydrolase, HD superfamily [Marinactinospora thermotolerans DSM 45154]